MSETIWSRIERGRERWDVLRHPFYRRWSAGELTREELARYAGQYRHAVTAIAELSAGLADALPEHGELYRHASEERGHVRLWDGFLEAVGGTPDAEPTQETAALRERWRDGGDALDGLARLYAIESAQPEISRTKRSGLLDHYGFSEGPATAYFKLHEGRDTEHAAEVRELITELADTADDDRIAAGAEAANRAYWRLLDAV